MCPVLSYVCVAIAGTWVADLVLRLVKYGWVVEDYDWVGEDYDGEDYDCCVENCHDWVASPGVHLQEFDSFVCFESLEQIILYLGMIP